jgi:N-acetylglucosamine repressor
LKSKKPTKKNERAMSVQAELLMHVRSRAGRISRVELAGLLGVVPSTSGIYVGQLIKAGYLIELEKSKSLSGRPPTMLALNPGGGQFIGIDFEAHKILALSIDFAQQTIKKAESEILPGDGDRQVIQKVIGMIRAVRHPELVLHGIGVGVPGPVDPVDGTAFHYEYIPGWRNVPVKNLLSAQFAVPVHVENNVRTMAYAELCFGRGHQWRDFVCLAARTGIGVGMAMDGKIHRGFSNLSGEIGWWPVPGPVQTPGRHRIRPAVEFPPYLQVKDLATVDALVGRIAAALAEGAESALAPHRESLSLDHVVGAARQGDPLCLKFVEETGAVLGRIAAQIALLVDPQTIILTGPLTQLGEAILGPANEALNRLSYIPFGRARTLEMSSMDDYSGALGAAAIALDAWRPSLPPKNV